VIRQTKEPVCLNHEANFVHDIELARRRQVERYNHVDKPMPPNLDRRQDSERRKAYAHQRKNERTTWSSKSTSMPMRGGDSACNCGELLPIATQRASGVVLWNRDFFRQQHINRPWVRAVIPQTKMLVLTFKNDDHKFRFRNLRVRQRIKTRGAVRATCRYSGECVADRH
jgi:hypothetical protein